MAWIDVSDTFFWISPVNRYKIGDKEFIMKKSQSLILDTGTSLCYIPWWH
jgi:hypothetical protein